MPSSYSNISEIALKTIPSASKIEIKRVLESLYGFEVERVRTLNMEGKKKKRGGLLIARSDYKKAYVTLKNPLSISPELFPIKTIEEEKKNMVKHTKNSSIVEDTEPKTTHWLDDKKPKVGMSRKRWSWNSDPPVRGGGDRADGTPAKFPWNNVKFSPK